jgi:two-component system LytT family response regulator
MNIHSNEFYFLLFLPNLFLMGNLHKTRAIIIDDEARGRENLILMLGSYCPEVEIIGEASSAVEGKDLIRSLKPDTVFLDINMPVINGIEMLETLSNRDFSLVFVTAYSDHGIQAVKAGAIDYIMKPISVKELQLAVKKIIECQSAVTDTSTPSKEEIRKLKVPQYQGFKILEQSDIRNPLVIASKTIKEFEVQLDKNSFFRIHKSHIINLNYLKEYANLDGGYAIMCDNTKLEISRRRLNDFHIKVKAFTSVNK